MIILSKHEVRDFSWPELVGHVVLEAKFRGATWLVIDTQAEWAGLAKDSENDSGSALWAMHPLQEAAAEGLAVLLLRHDSKAGGDVGVAGRGSSAFTGAVDISLLLKRSGSGDSSTRRELQAVGRFDDTPAMLVIDLRDGVYVPLGSTADALKLDAGNLILDTLPNLEGDATTETELIESVGESGVSKGTIGTALRELVAEGSVMRIGEGKRNHAYKYYRTPNSLSQPYIKAWEKENLNGQTGGHLVKMALEMEATITGVYEDDSSKQDS